MERAECEIVVVGAGPSGCGVARRLAERGRDVVLADENSEARDDIVCTGIVGEEAFRRLDPPEEAVVDAIPSARFVSPGGEVVAYEPDGGLARVVDRTRFDGALARSAVGAGARLERGWAARGVEKDGGGVTVAFESADGPARVRARALVVATGHQRWLHEAAGLGTPERYVHGVHADLPFEGAEAAELYFGNELAPGFFGWVVPFGEAEARLGVLARQGADRHFLRLLRHPAVRDRVETPAGDVEPPAAAPWLQSRGIVQGPVTPSFADRVVGVGEAAGQVKTTTAGGIYYGLQGAELAADVLDAACADGRLDARRLSAYEEAWIDRLGPEIEAGLKLQAAVREMPDEEIDRLFAALDGGLGALIRGAITFDWHRPALEVLFRHPGLRRRLAERSPAPVGGDASLTRTG